MRLDLSNYQELVIKQVKLDRDLSKWWDSQFPCKQPFLPIPTNNYSKTLEVVNARDCYLVPSEWLRSFTDLATEGERHLTTGKRAERTKLDFRCPICRSAIGQLVKPVV